MPPRGAPPAGAAVPAAGDTAPGPGATGTAEAGADGLPGTNAAKDYLASLGVDASRIKTVSYGKERPFATGHDEDSWQKNRRAHFVVTAK